MTVSPLRKIYDNIPDDFTINRDCLTLIRKVGGGNFGCVYLAEAGDIMGHGTVTEVAVKALIGTVYDVVFVNMLGYSFISVFFPSKHQAN